MMRLLGEGVGRAASELGVDPVKPITLLGVAALGEPDLFIEVEATAAMEESHLLAAAVRVRVSGLP